MKIVRFDDSVSFIGRKKNLKDIRYDSELNFDFRHSNYLFVSSISVCFITCVTCGQKNDKSVRAIKVTKSRKEILVLSILPKNKL